LDDNCGIHIKCDHIIFLVLYYLRGVGGMAYETSRAFIYLEKQLDWRYCPYCGKEIQVVE